MIWYEYDLNIWWRFLSLCFGLLRLGWTSRIYSAAHLTSKAPGWLPDWTGQTGAVFHRHFIGIFHMYIVQKVYFQRCSLQLQWSSKTVALVALLGRSSVAFTAAFGIGSGSSTSSVIWSPSRQQWWNARSRSCSSSVGSWQWGCRSIEFYFILQTWLHVACVMLSGWELVEIRSQECQYRPTFCWKVKAIGKHQRMSPTWWCNSSISNKFLESCVLSKAVQALQSQRPSRGLAASVCATLSPCPRQGQRASCFWNALGGHLTFFPEPVVIASKPGISWIWSLQVRTSNGM